MRIGISNALFKPRPDTGQPVISALCARATLASTTAALGDGGTHDIAGAGELLLLA